MFTKSNRRRNRVLQSFVQDSGSRRRRKRRFAPETLEERRLLTVFTVTNTNSSGPGSLAGLIQAANNAAGSDEIRFDPSLSGSTISVGSRLDISDDLDIVGLGADSLTLDSNHSAPVFYVASGDNVTMSGLSITGGNADAWGDRGGGIRNAGTLTVTASRIYDNDGELGAGIYNEGTLVLRDSTVDSNDAGSSGGGIYNIGDATIINSTIAVNTSSSSGSGIFINTSSVTTRITNSTIALNQSSGSGGGLEGWVADSTQLNNTLVIGNRRSGNVQRDIWGNSVDTSNAFHNLIGNPATGGGLIEGLNGNMIGDGLGNALPVGDVLVWSLEDNGGPTPTYALLQSRAVDGGSNSRAIDQNGASLLTDQRGAGFTRLIDGNHDSTATVDVGAVEAGIPQQLMVSTLNDELDGNFGDGELSLREAVQISNARAGLDTITFAAALNDSVILQDDFRYILTDDVDIQGPGADTLTIDGQSGSQVFVIDPGTTASISGLSITGGDAAGWGSNGGAILNNGDLTLMGMHLFENEATRGGGVWSDGTLVIRDSTLNANTATSEGGGVFNSGSATIINSTISGNEATWGTGVLATNIAGSTLLRNVTVTRNRSTGSGAGIQKWAGTLHLDNTLVAGNTQSNGARNDINGSIDTANSFNNLIGDPGTAGGLIESQNGNMLGDGTGGELSVHQILAPTLADHGGPTPVHALLHSRAIDGGVNARAIDENGDSLTADQRGATFDRLIDGSGNGTATVDVGAFEATIPDLVVNTLNDTIDGDYSALSLREALQISDSRTGTDTITFDPTLNGSTIVVDTQWRFVPDDDVEIHGPGADSLTIDMQQRSHAFWIRDGITATVSGLSITGGDADGWGDKGGGFRNEGTLTVENVRIFDNIADDGGGIHNDGTLIVRNSTIDANDAAFTGGGIYNGGDAHVINSTVSGNEAMFGTGISAATASDGTILTNSTVALNQSTLDGGGIQRLGGALPVLNNTLVIGNVRSNGARQEITGSIDTINSFANLIGDPTTAAGLVEGIRSNLLGDGNGNIVSPASVIDTSLADNGGQTPTHALRTDRAVDSGLNSRAIDEDGLALTTDQRGQPRMSGQVGIGSVEALLGAVDDGDTTTAGTPVNINVTANDTPGSHTEVRSVGDGTNGTASINPDGTVRYTPNGGFTGTDSFQYSTGIQGSEHSSGGATSEEGNAVAIDGEWAVVGARRDDMVATNAGAAFIYRRNGAVWELFQELRPAEIEFRDRFGYSVAISSSTIVIGARLDNDLGSRSGSAYVFEYDAARDEFVQTQKLLDEQGTPQDQFGHSVALEGDVLAIGARRDGRGASNSGAVVLFERSADGSGFRQVKRIKPDDAASGDQFGWSVALSGETLAVGAWKDDESGRSDAGSVYVFERNNGGSDHWGQAAKLVAAAARPNDWFGFSVDVEGDDVLVGKPIRHNRIRIGEVHLFNRHEGGAHSWGERTMLPSPNSRLQDQFGHSVRLTGDAATIGARLDRTVANNAGAVYMFDRNEGGTDNWGHTDSWFGQQGEWFGFAAEYDGTTLLVGANGSDIAGKDSGRVYFHDLRTEAATVTVQVNQNQLSASGPGTGSAEALTEANLAPIVRAARDHWQASSDLSAEQQSALIQAEVNIRALDGVVLGYHSGGDVVIDTDAAGHGWYVDPTPYDLTDDTIGNRMDLLSNVTHELGHVLGLTDEFGRQAAGSVMSGYLSVGERTVQSVSALDLLFSRSDLEEDALFAM